MAAMMPAMVAPMVGMSVPSALERFWSGRSYGRGRNRPEGGAMKYVRRLSLLAAALVTLASALALQAAAGPPNHANRLEATFAETNVSVTNRIADLGIFQLINTGTGTVEGFGDATMTLGHTGSDRPPVRGGKLDERRHPSDRAGRGRPRPPRARPRLSDRSGTDRNGHVGGRRPSSTGIFAGARGSGDDRIVLATRYLHALRDVSTSPKVREGEQGHGNHPGRATAGDERLRARPGCYRRSRPPGQHERPLDCVRRAG